MLFCPTGWFRSDSAPSEWNATQIAEQADYVCQQTHAARDRGETTISFDPSLNLDVLHIDGDFEGWYRDNC